MANLRPGAIRAMQFFGSILNGAFNGASTADIWSALREGAANAGVNLSELGISGSDISQLRGYAGSIVRSSQIINTMAPDLALPPLAVAEAPWSQGNVDQSLNPSFTVRFVASLSDPAGNVTTQWMSVQTGSLPATVGGVIDLAQSSASALAERYQSNLVGIAGIHITVAA